MGKKGQVIKARQGQYANNSNNRSKKQSYTKAKSPFGHRV